MESLHNIIVATVKSYTPVHVSVLVAIHFVGFRILEPSLYMPLCQFSGRWQARLAVGAKESGLLGLLCDCVHYGRLNTPSLEESVTSL